MTTKIRNDQLDTGTLAGQIVELEAGSPAGPGKLPAVDGSNLIGVSGSGGLNNVVEDTTPQLGGNLDVNDFDLISKPPAGATSSAGHLDIKASNGGATSGTGGTVTIWGGNSYGSFSTGGYVNIRPGSVGAANYAFAGNINLQGQTSTGTESGGSNIFLTAGGGEQPGGIFLKAGNNINNFTVGGEVKVEAGKGGSATAGGIVNIFGGDNTSGGDAGHIVLNPGSSSAGAQGWVELDSTGLGESAIFRFTDANASNYVGLKSPEVVTANRTWALPQDDPAALGTGSPHSSYFLTTNASGELSFAAVAGGGISAVVEDTTPQLGGDLSVNGNVITAEAAATATSAGNDITINATDGGATSGAGGDIFLNAGNSSGGSSYGGDIDMKAGDGSAYIGGRVLIEGGDTTSGVGGGEVRLIGGTFTGNFTQAGTLRVAGAQTSTAGGAYVTGGSGSNTNAHGGDAKIVSGQGGTGGSATNGGDIILQPGTGNNGGADGAINLGPQTPGNAPCDVRFMQNTNYVAFKAPASVSANVVYTLPDAAPTAAGQFLTSTPAGSPAEQGIMSWATPAGGSGTFTELGNGTIYGGLNAGANITAGSPTVGGAHNFLAGTNAGQSLTTGDYNIFVGKDAGRDASATSQAIFIGLEAGASSGTAVTGIGNIGLGYRSLYNVVSNGFHNVAIGHQAGYQWRLGTHNICIGYRAGAFTEVNADGDQNVVIGLRAGTDLDDGNSNVCIGADAGGNLQDGNDNVCIGDAAGFRLNASAGSNICIGPSAGPTAAGPYDTGSSKLFIDIAESDTPLIFGDFVTNEITINGDLEATGNVVGHLDINAQTGTTYTLQLSDDGKLITMDNASANTLKIPTDSDVDFPIGTQILVSQEGAGTTTIQSAGAGSPAGGSPPGVTIHSANDAKDFANQYTTVTLIKKAANTWLLVGDLI